MISLPKFCLANVIILTTLLVNPQVTNAAELAGVKFPSTVSIQTATLKLNGLGIRKATIFRVKVYVAALYLTEKTQNPSQIIASSSPKKLIMHFLREVTAEKIRSGWSDGFKNNTDNVGALNKRIDTFNSYMTDMKAGQKIELLITENEASVFLQGKLKGTIAGSDFCKALLSIWLGKNPPNEDLKSGMLGKD